MDIMDERPLPLLLEPLGGGALRRSKLECGSVWYAFFLLCDFGDSPPLATGSGNCNG
jgi:hypothetical protein